MAAFCLAAAPSATLEPFGRSNRQELAAGWLAPSPQRHSTGRDGANLSARRLTVRPRAAAPSASELATYQLPHRGDGTTSEWFQAAVRDIVKHVEEAPMLQTVQLGGGGASPRCATYSVHESVVAVPELWHSIAEHVSQHSPDVVLLVQRVRPTGAGQQQQQQQQQGATADGPSTSTPGSPRLRSSGSSELRAHTEEVCRRLVSAGVAEAILLHGQVGDCCDGSGEGDHHDGDSAPSPPAGEAPRQQPPPRPLPLPSIVPFSPSPAGATGAARRAVRAAALRPVGEQGSPARAAEGQQQATAYWGVVVQSRRQTGAEGCYLLKTVKSTSASTGCTCTHFSLTRISQGDHLEQQFVQSWLL